jgi:hypothetical protein
VRLLLALALAVSEHDYRLLVLGQAGQGAFEVDHMYQARIGFAGAAFVPSLAGVVGGVSALHCGAVRGPLGQAADGQQLAGGGAGYGHGWPGAFTQVQIPAGRADRPA